MDKKYSKYLILVYEYWKYYKSTSTEWILFSNVGGLNMSGKYLSSNPFGRTQVNLSKGFEAESFSLKYQHPIFENKIHSVEVDLYYFKYL